MSDEIKKITAAAAEQKAEFFDTLLQTSCDGIIITDEGQEITVANENFCSLFDLPEGEVTTANLTGLLSRVDSSAPIQWQELLKEVDTKGTACKTELKIDINSKIKYVAVNASRLKPVDKESFIISTWRDISAEKLAEEKLLESDIRFRTIVDQSPFSIMVYLPDGRPLLVNQAAAELWGYSPEDLEYIFQNYNIFKDEMLRTKGIMPYLEKAFAGEYMEIPPVEYDQRKVKISTASGRGMLWVRSYLYPVKYGEGGVSLVVMMHEDITERKRAEDLTRLQLDLGEEIDAAEDLNEALSLCVEAAIEVSDMDSGGIYLVDGTTGNLILVCYQGLSAEFISAASFFSADSPNTRLVMEGKPIYQEYSKLLPEASDPVREKEGLSFIAILPVLYENRVIACMNIASHTRSKIAVTEKNALETFAFQIGGIISRLQAEEALRESEERYRSLQTNIPVGIFRTTPEGKIMSANPAMVKMFGFASQDELLEVPAVDFYVHREDRNKLLKRLKEQDVVTGYEVQLNRKDGSYFWGSFTIKGVTDHKGKIIYHDGILEDVSERKKVDEELQKAEKLESLGLLAGGIAHDFNNILTSILVNVTLSRNHVNKDVKSADRLSEAEKAIYRAKDLTQQLLTFSRGGAPIRSQASIENLLKDTTEFALSGSNIKCDFAIADNLRDVDIDEGQISQVIQNLVMNAVQAMPGGGTMLISADNISIKAGDTLPLEAGNYIKISVKDHGVGIPGEILQKIFDPFFSTKQKGSGLGLSTAYSIIKNHNGIIEVDSESGNGTTFYVYLPASKRRRVKKESDEEMAAAGQGKILLMDDEETILDATSDMLREMGYTVEVAKDGLEAVNLYKAAMQSGQPFDSVIMDLVVPGGMGGLDTFGELKKLDPGLKAVVSSGYSTDPIMANYKDYGFAGSVSKPYKIKDMSEVLRKAIGSKKKRKPKRN